MAGPTHPLPAASQQPGNKHLHGGFQVGDTAPNSADTVHSSLYNIYVPPGDASVLLCLVSINSQGEQLPAQSH